MFMKVGKRFGWLAGLAFCPMAGWGQEIIRDPQNATVCIGEEATFTSETKSELWGWIINGIMPQNLPPEKYTRLDFSNSVTPNRTIMQVLKFIKYDEFFDGVEVKLAAGNIGSLSIFSNAAYLSYETNQQFQVTDLTPTVTGITAQFDWNAYNSNFTTNYLSGVYDHNNNLIASQITNTTHVSFDLAPSTCKHLVFRFTANQCPAPDGVFEQNEATTYIYREPDIDTPTVTAEFVNKTVLVNVLDGDSTTYWVSITDLDRGNQTTYNGTSPFNYTPALCGQYNLNFEVSPAQCAGEPGFTYSDNISFTINCPTTTTEATEATETEGQPSGTQAIAPSSLPIIAAAAMLLKHYYEEVR